MRHLVAFSKQEDVYKDCKMIISKIMIGIAAQKNDPKSIRIRNSKYPKLLCDLYSGVLTELLRQWLENKFDISPKELLEFLEKEF